MNVLYDKDHYKLALGQLNTARNLMDKLTKGVSAQLGAPRGWCRRPRKAFAHAAPSAADSGAAAAAAA